MALAKTKISRLMGSGVRADHWIDLGECRWGAIAGENLAISYDSRDLRAESSQVLSFRGPGMGDSGFQPLPPAIGDPLAYYSRYMPALLLFYLGYPLVFSVLIYRLRLGNRGLFLAMIVGIVVVEILFTHNMLLLTLPICLLAIPISLGHYGMVTFMPMWIAERTVRENRKWVAGYVGRLGGRGAPQHPHANRRTSLMGRRTDAVEDQFSTTRPYPRSG